MMATEKKVIKEVANRTGISIEKVTAFSDFFKKNFNSKLLNEEITYLRINNLCSLVVNRNHLKGRTFRCGIKSERMKFLEDRLNVVEEHIELIRKKQSHICHIEKSSFSCRNFYLDRRKYGEKQHFQNTWFENTHH